MYIVVSYAEVTNGWKDQPWGQMRTSTAFCIFRQPVGNKDLLYVISLKMNAEGNITSVFIPLCFNYPESKNFYIIAVISSHILITHTLYRLHEDL
jgi:hypothetical protein